MIDRVTDLIYEVSAIGHKNVTINEPHFQGHFPKKPIMPGVLIVEAMAQTAAVMVGFSSEIASENFLVYFLAIDRCKFRKKVVPGDVLELDVIVVRGKIGSKAWKFSGVASVDGCKVAEAEFTAMIDLEST